MALTLSRKGVTILVSPASPSRTIRSLLKRGGYGKRGLKGSLVSLPGALVRYAPAAVSSLWRMLHHLSAGIHVFPVNVCLTGRHKSSNGLSAPGCEPPVQVHRVNATVDRGPAHGGKFRISVKACRSLQTLFANLFTCPVQDPKGGVEYVVAKVDDLVNWARKG